MTGATGSGCGEVTSRWEMTASYRYFRSHRHFRGTNEEENRAAEESEVINTVHQSAVSLKYTFNDRWSLTGTIPYFSANRSSPIRNDDREVIGRSVTHADGISDITFLARWYVLDPATHPQGNLWLGPGIKFPTGASDVRDRRDTFDSDTQTIVDAGVSNVDQSIQPGDGGLGAILDFGGYLSSKRGAATFYGSVFYLFNPEVTDHVETGRRRESEKYMSISDQYLVRVGGAFGGPTWNGWTAGIGGRWEGVPARDAFGSSEWFRRPGYSISAEPWLSWSRGSNSVSVALPVAIHRERIKSVPDIKDDRHGDAAFADWSLQISYSHRFASKARTEHHDAVEHHAE